MEPGYKKRVASDFDQIAYLEAENWNANNHYYDYLLRQIPENFKIILDIGCGTGDFCKRLADKAEEVIGLDFSPKMITVAKENGASFKNISFQCRDYLQTEYGEEHFDCIISIAALHHIPIEAFFTKTKKELKSSGKLIILDLFQNETFLDYFYSVLSYPISKFNKLIYNHRFNPTKESRVLWEKHGEHDRYLTFSQVLQMSKLYLKEAKVRRHLFWRYSLIWTKP